MTHRSRLAHFVIDVDDLDQGVAFWSAALDAKEETLSEASSQVYRRLRLPDSEDLQEIFFSGLDERGMRYVEGR